MTLATGKPTEGADVLIIATVDFKLTFPTSHTPEDSP